MQSFNLLGQHPFVANQSHAPRYCKLGFKNQSTVLGQPLAAQSIWQPSVRKTSSGGTISRTVRATIAEPSSKNTINTWSRGEHWQVRIAILSCLYIFHPLHMIFYQVQLQILYIYIMSTPINLLYIFYNTVAQIWWDLRCQR